MAVTDSVSDMLTRIRNANKERKEHVDITYSWLGYEIGKILLKEGFIKNLRKVEKSIRIYLKYSPSKVKVISGIRRVSKSSLRIYVKSGKIPSVLGGLGIAVISTSKGVMTDKEAKKHKVGGEVLCHVW